VTPDRRLTDNFKAKLGEIFAAQLDLDGDGALNDAELDRLVFLTEGTLSFPLVHTQLRQREDGSPTSRCVLCLGQRITPDMAEFIRTHFETNDEVSSSVALV
jgi:hypothetical protein